MTAAITLKARIEAYDGDQRIAWAYRAFAEPGQPYVVVLDVEDLPRLAITQYPTTTLLRGDEFDPDEAEAHDLQNVIMSIKALAALAVKARAYDELFDGIEENEDEIDYEPVDLDGPSADQDSDGPFVVDTLGDDETDMEWVDNDGDHYKHINGEWYVAYEGDTPWRPVTDEGPQYLTEYGPYRAVGKA
jgi:hypothetical protein